MLGEAASIGASAFLFGQVRLAWPRIAPDARVPLFFARSGNPALRAGKALGLCLLPSLAAAGLLMISFRFAGAMDGKVFTLQLMAAIGFVVAHTVRLKSVLEVLEAEGKLRPPAGP